MFSINNLQASALRAKSTSSVDSGGATTGSPASPTVRTPAGSKKSATAKIVSNPVSLTPEEEEKVKFAFAVFLLLLSFENSFDFFFGDLS